jgi:hypothetical protein
MPEPNTPQKTLESWKQIAAFLDRSERTVLRWEAHEGLPVHRRGHQKHDTVFAFRHEIEAWTRRRTKFAETGATSSRENHPFSQVNSPANSYLVEYDAITRTMERYIAGAREGDGELMRPAFHPEATISGYCQGSEYSGSVEHVFEWIIANGPAPSIEPRFARIEIIETIALVHLEVDGLVRQTSRCEQPGDGCIQSSKAERRVEGHAQAVPLAYRLGFLSARSSATAHTQSGNRLTAIYAHFPKAYAIRRSWRHSRLGRRKQ